ncbi:hypothetical protein A3Q56_03825 [Intoshia linei]|uniref:TOG domain-containing protein n=1 Tax=Intoshia linei TaxID=1819745 RepID=A0A177B2L9_9BILA|nr:hypothetical protein A3Q56_03825 [Intoshia linei]
MKSNEDKHNPHDCPDFSPDNELYPINVLADELTSDDMQIKIQSINNLETIALALGTQKTRDELIPFLLENNGGEDELLIAIAEKLGNFNACLGGDEYAHCIIPIFESLGTVEETLVRDVTIKSYKKILSTFSQHQIEEYAVPSLKRLIAGEWFTARVSAANLFHSIYERLKENFRGELRISYRTLCSDETPMVRRCAASNFIFFLNHIDGATFRSDLLSSYNSLIKDEEETVRENATTCLASIIKICCNSGSMNVLIEITKFAFEGKDWGVRIMGARDIISIQRAFGKTVKPSHMIKFMESCLKDEESGIRSLAIQSLSDFCEYLPEDEQIDIIIETFLPIMNQLCLEQSNNVRSSLSISIAGISKILKKELAIKHILPIWLALLHNDSSDIRFSILEEMMKMANTIGYDEISQRIVPMIEEICADPKWRVRHSFLKCIKILSEHMGTNFFNEYMANPFLETYLNDSVLTIRNTAAELLSDLVKPFGVVWAQENIIPVMVQQLNNSTNYLRRLTLLYALRLMAESCGSEVFLQCLLPIILKLGLDKVSNVRFNVCKLLEKLAPLMDSTTINTKVKQLLDNLAKDDDDEVKWYAKSALKSMNLPLPK